LILKNKNKKKEYKWKTGIDSVEIDLDHEKSVSDLSNISWENIRACKRSTSGSQGVFFVDVGNGIVVMKGINADTSPFLFASILSYKLGIYVPPFQILLARGDNDELTEIARIILAKLEEVDPGGSARYIFDRKYVLLQKFVQGKTMSEWDYLSIKDIFDSEDELNELGKKRMTEIGSVLYLDVLLNNGDRLPLIWQNQGNSGNLMLDKFTGQVISIDSSGSPININLYPQRVEEYYAKVKKLLVNIKEHKGKVIDPFRYIGQTIGSFTDFNVGEDGLMLIQEGFLNSFRRMKNLNITEEQINEWKNIINELEITEIPDYFTEFLTNVYHIFNEEIDF